MSLPEIGSRTDCLGIKEVVFNQSLETHEPVSLGSIGQVLRGIFPDRDVAGVGNVLTSFRTYFHKHHQGDNGIVWRGSTADRIVHRLLTGDAYPPDWKTPREIALKAIASDTRYARLPPLCAIANHTEDVDWALWLTRSKYAHIDSIFRAFELSARRALPMADPRVERIDIPPLHILQARLSSHEIPGITVHSQTISQQMDGVDCRSNFWFPSLLFRPLIYVGDKGVAIENKECGHLLDMHGQYLHRLAPYQQLLAFQRAALKLHWFGDVFRRYTLQTESLSEAFARVAIPKNQFFKGDEQFRREEIWTNTVLLLMVERKMLTHPLYRQLLLGPTRLGKTFDLTNLSVPDDFQCGDTVESTGIGFLANALHIPIGQVIDGVQIS